jgi:serpin B
MTIDPAAIFGLTSSYNDLGFELYAKLRGDGDFAVSPASIGLAASLACLGARGRTAAQMREAMHFQLPDADLLARTALLIRTWTAPRPASPGGGAAMELRVANRVFGRVGLELEAAYTRAAAEQFAAPVELLDFGGQAEACRTRVNRWVEEQTNGRIRDLLPPPSVHAATLLVLANALYFRAAWAHPFSTWSTRPAGFQLASGETVQVAMMNETMTVRTAETADARILEVPYGESGFAFFVVLPRMRDGLPGVEAHLRDGWIDGWYRRLAWSRTALSLPKFRVESPESLPLAGPLRSLGMVDAFDPGAADFTGIAAPWRGLRLVFEEVFHKVFVEVDEQGTEAAAATAFVAIPGAAPRAEPPPVPFVVDHPFLFLIGHAATGAVLFVGRVTHPKSG